MKIMFCGSRDIEQRDVRAIEILFDKLYAPSPEDVVIHGGSRGVDETIDRLATRRFIEVDVYGAKWKDYGRAAGPIRNQEMIDEADMVVAFWDGRSRGTKDSISRAISALSDGSIESLHIHLLPSVRRADQ